MTRLYVLQSGFVTTANEELVRSDQPEKSLKERIISDHRVIDSENYYDEEVEHLFNTWRKNESVMRQFEFREAILVAAARVFRGNVDSIVPWLRLQMSQRTVGYLHRRFLKEMVVSSWSGVEKTIDNYSFYRLLSARFSSDDMQTRNDRVEDSLDNIIKDLSSTKLSSFLCSWTKDLRGFGDLLSSLHVIYGRRDASFHSTGRAGSK